MGGCNSGGWNATGRPTTADIPRINVNSLNKAGALRDGFTGAFRWNFVEGRSSVIYRASSNHIVLSRAGASQPYTEEVFIIWEPCRFGGRRPFFTCPVCGRRTLHLYCLGYFACRECHDVSYPSQRERESDRAQRRANKIRVRLGGEPGWHNLPRRPKGMHRGTYLNLIGKIVADDAVTDQYAAKLFGL